ncbi:MAG: ComEA family DNA-binding protein [Flavobacterium sp.]
MKTLFHLTKGQRKGIIALLFLIVFLQLSYFWWKSQRNSNFSIEEVEWLSMQQWIDSVSISKDDNVQKVYPFNPNFISDFKAYRLGLSTAEFDRLTAFRAQNKYVNSAAEFQSVTRVSDSLLAEIAPFFKFPDWVNKKKNNNNPYQFKQSNSNKETLGQTDINVASQEDLVKVYGVGAVTAQKILDFRERLGGFVDIQQLNDIWGIKPGAITEIEKYFYVGESQNVKRLNINKANMKSISEFPYFNSALAREMVTYRTMNNGIAKIEDLTKINGFPIEKLKIIALYLEF